MAGTGTGREESTVSAVHRGGKKGGAYLKRLRIRDIRRTREAQARVTLSEDVIRQYSEVMAARSAVFPPVTVWFDGDAYWLSDGFHRLEAAELAGITEFDAEIHRGGLREAVWDSFSGIPETTLRRWRQELTSPNGEVSVREALEGDKAYSMRVGRIGGQRKEKCRKWTSRAELLSGLEEMKGKASRFAMPVTIATLRSLVDPGQAHARSDPNKRRRLWIVAGNMTVLCIAYLRAEMETNLYARKHSALLRGGEVFSGPTGIEPHDLQC